METQRPPQQQFASDNYSGICPEAMDALARVNSGHVPSYGDDRWTAEVCDLFREIFDAPCEVFFVFNGTAGNALSLAALCRSYHGVICHRYAHVSTDECGAPEFFSHGAKLLTIDGADGKIDPLNIHSVVTRRTDIHFPKPRVVTVTQATELGTVYTADELKAIHEAARPHELKIQMDGARFANALVHLDVAPSAITRDAGVDVLCLGGSKNGLAIGEAVIFFDLEAAEEFAYRCKQAGQLASKMRYVSAQYVALLEDGLWRRNAENANAMAALLADRVRTVPGVRITQAVDANEVFAILPREVIGPLAEEHDFYVWDERADEVRWVTSWDTTTEDVERFAAAVAEACAGVGA